MGYELIQAPTKKHPPVLPDHAWYQTPEGCAYVSLAYQPTCYGKKMLLVCPICGARRTKLYVENWHIGCRSHIAKGGIYRGIQYTTKGGEDRIAYTMQKIADKNMISFRIGEEPLSYLCEDKRPRYMNKYKFSDVVSRLYILDELRVHVIMKSHPISGKRSSGHLERNIPLIRFIERSSSNELRELISYISVMSFAQYVYGKDWGFPIYE